MWELDQLELCNPDLTCWGWNTAAFIPDSQNVLLRALPIGLLGDARVSSVLQQMVLVLAIHSVSTVTAKVLLLLLVLLHNVAVYYSVNGVVAVLVLNCKIGCRCRSL